LPDLDNTEGKLATHAESQQTYAHLSSPPSAQIFSGQSLHLATMDPSDGEPDRLTMEGLSLGADDVRPDDDFDDDEEDLEMPFGANEENKQLHLLVRPRHQSLSTASSILAPDDLPAVPDAVLAGCPLCPECVAMLGRAPSGNPIDCVFVSMALAIKALGTWHVHSRRTPP